MSNHNPTTVNPDVELLVTVHDTLTREHGPEAAEAFVTLCELRFARALTDDQVTDAIGALLFGETQHAWDVIATAQTTAHQAAAVAA